MSIETRISSSSNSSMVTTSKLFSSFTKLSDSKSEKSLPSDIGPEELIFSNENEVSINQAIT